MSGLNVAMLAGIAWYLLKPLRVPRRAAVVIIIPLLCAYALVTGLSASCVRATVMASFILLGQLIGRPAIAMNSLAAAAVAILAWDTEEFFTPGFQLSFALVAFIMGLSGPIARWMEPFGAPDDFIPQEIWTRGERWRVSLWKQIAGTTGVTLSAWVGSFVFMAGYFHLISPVAVFANAVAVPLAFVVLALGLMSLLCGIVSTALAAIVNQANLISAKALLASLALFQRRPAATCIPRCRISNARRPANSCRSKSATARRFMSAPAAATGSWTAAVRAITTAHCSPISVRAA